MFVTGVQTCALPISISLGLTDCRLVTDAPMPATVRATDKLHAIGASNPSPETIVCEHDASAVVPTGGGRFLRLSDGTCNQVLMTYVPALEAKQIATASPYHWRTVDHTTGISRLRETIAFLWRVNEHLWHEHIYANPTFTYYLGHTSLELKLPGTKKTPKRTQSLADLLQNWNAWLRPPKGENGFLQVLAEEVEVDEQRKEEEPVKVKVRPPQTALKFFCHKVIVMHPYTDESLLGDMLRRVAFWGERSVADVHIADAIVDILE